MTDLSPKQIKAIGLLASGVTQKLAAKSVGVSAETVCGWQKQAEFQAALNRIKRESIDAARDSLRSGVGDAVRTLQELTKPSKADGIRLRAAVSLLDVAFRICDNVGPTDPKKIARNAQLDAASDKLLDDIADLGMRGTVKPTRV